jgi:proteasome lid subunit RPN8/RPN11
MRISRQLLEELVEHARAEAPNECCGVIATRDGEALSVHRLTNIHHSPLKYEADGRELLEATTAIDEAGLHVGANYHSHTRSEPVPSQTDVNLADMWPDPELVHIIVGLAGDEPDVRAYSILHGEVREHPLEIT